MEELKSLVASTLESKGVLAKIRAELRAHVFRAIEEQESAQLRKAGGGSDAAVSSTPSRRVQSINATPSASLLLDLVREWLDFYELDYTSSTLSAEAALSPPAGGASPTAPRDRATLAAALHMPRQTSEERPLLLELLLQHTQGGSQGGASRGPVPTHSPQHSLSDIKERERDEKQPPPHPGRPTASQPAFMAPDLDLDSPPAGSHRHDRLSAARRSADSSDLSSPLSSPTASSPSSSPPPAASSTAAPISPPNTTSPPTSTSRTSLDVNLASSQPAQISPANADGSAGTSSRRRRDRNLDMAAIHTLVQTPSPSNAATLTSAPSPSSSSSLGKLAPLPSLAMNRNAPLPPVDVPIIELEGGSDIEGSAGDGDLEQSRDGAADKSFQSDGGRGGGEGGEDESADGTSVDMDRARLDEVNRMIHSYQQQGKMASRPGGPPGHDESAGSSANSSANASHSQSYDGLNTSDPHPTSAPSSNAAAVAAAEDSYEDDEFAASDIAGGSGEIDDGIEESLEVEEEEEVEGGGSASGSTRGAKAEDSLDAAYFASNHSVDQAPTAAARMHSVGATAGRRAGQRGAGSADHSSDQLDASASQYDESHDEYGASESSAPRDPSDAYSEDQSVNEPLENDFDYAEDVEPVGR